MRWRPRRASSSTSRAPRDSRWTTSRSPWRARASDEGLVAVVEPHMYNVDDAVAKIDGYIISIAGAAAHVGEKRMVRIDQVGRTAASALLLDECGEGGRPAPRSPAPRGGAGRRSSSSTREGGRAGGRAKTRARGRRAPADSE